MSRRFGTPNSGRSDPDGCLMWMIVLVFTAAMLLVVLPHQQRVRERSWTIEEKEDANRPIGERLGRSVGRFSVNFGKGFWKGAHESQKKGEP